MTLLLMSPIPARVVQVLKDFFNTELASVDSQAADGFTSATIPTDTQHYFEWDQKNIGEYPACSIEALWSRPLDVLSKGFGDRVNVLHRLNVKFHARISDIQSGSEPRDLDKLLHRYIVAAVRVLADQKDGLETTADPVRWGSPGVMTVVTWPEQATYGPESDQADGAIVRTATLPIDVQRIEPR